MAKDDFTADVSKVYRKPSAFDCFQHYCI